MNIPKTSREQQVFLSYSRIDLWEYRAIYNEIKLSGIRLWVDDELEPGTKNWRASLYRALKDSVCLVCICSPNSAGSKWVRRELEQALELNLPIYPIIVSGTGTEEVLPQCIRDIQASDCRSDYYQTIDRFVTKLTSQHPQTLVFDMKEFSSNNGINWTHLGSLFWFASEVRKIRLILQPEEFEKPRVLKSLSQLKHHAARLNADVYTMRDIDHVITALGTKETDLSESIISQIESKLRHIQDNIALEAEKLDHSFSGGPFGGAPLNIS